MNTTKGEQNNRVATTIGLGKWGNENPWGFHMEEIGKVSETLSLLAKAVAEMSSASLARVLAKIQPGLSPN